MGIDIYAMWKGQTVEEHRQQVSDVSLATAGKMGYIREAYHGEPYPTEFLCSEAFETGRAQIPASVLRERLPRTLDLVEERARKIYKAHGAVVQEIKQVYSDFVSLCERKEIETGEPVLIVADF
jgi:hypothetical protein